jgi:hypothetical protein
MSSRAWRWARKSLLGCIELALLVAPLCASAMFRCQARDGAISYTSQAIANARCTRLNGMADAGAGAKAMALPRLVQDDDSGAVRIRVWTFIHKGIRQYVSRRPVGISARVDVLELYYIKGCYLCMAPKDFKVASLRLDTRSYLREIEAASGQFGVDRALVRAVIGVSPQRHFRSRRLGADAVDARHRRALRRGRPVRRTTEHSWRRALPGLAAQALQRQLRSLSMGMR